jgi:hypothetical protein
LLNVKQFEAKQIKTLHDSGLLMWDTGNQIWYTVSCYVPDNVSYYGLAILRCK